ncbi:hypothetical protein [Burkholderia vietnamiensis]|uniref:hypothetical protein n=1 Tax=Burkholderia vietnamiensis TaxID=60552 RepID=UPI0012DAEDC0|nr:hypothetical protein [Burkholderia vietnamiensis]
MVSKSFMSCGPTARQPIGCDRRNQKARSQRSTTGGKYVIGNVEENGKKYREFPEKMRFFDGAGLLDAVRRGSAKSSYGCRSKHRGARKNNRPDSRAGDVPSTLHRMSGSGAPVAGGCRAAARRAIRERK